jgi:hypothetical protein
MNAPAYQVVTTAHFDRLLKKLASKHPEFKDRLAEAAAILSMDPYNKSHKFQIRKLRDVVREKASSGCVQEDFVFVTTS